MAYSDLSKNYNPLSAKGEEKHVFQGCLPKARYDWYKKDFELGCHDIKDRLRYLDVTSVSYLLSNMRGR